MQPANDFSAFAQAPVPVIAFVRDRVNRPAADGDGNLPERDDYRTTIGLGRSF